MAVKLLPKSEIANLKAKEQAREIKEGVKIATRVDGLRELWAKTEQDYENYKKSTLGAIQKEIEEATAQKDLITGQLRSLKAEYDLLLPEIPMKRAKLAEFEKKLFSWERKLEKREEKAALLEIDVAEAKQKAQNARLRNEDNERITANLLRQAAKQRDETTQTLQTAKRIQEQALQDEKDTRFLLELRENNIKAREKELTGREVFIMNKEKALDTEKIKVEDMRQTLERSLERIRRGRLA